MNKTSFLDFKCKSEENFQKKRAKEEPKSLKLILLQLCHCKINHLSDVSHLKFISSFTIQHL